MIEINGKIFRNLEEQVGKNKLDIASILGNELKATLLTSQPFDSLSMLGGNPLLLKVDIDTDAVIGDYNIIELVGDVSNLNGFYFPTASNFLTLDIDTVNNKLTIGLHIGETPLSDEELFLAIGKSILEV